MIDKVICGFHVRIKKHNDDFFPDWNSLYTFLFLEVLHFSIPFWAFQPRIIFSYCIAYLPVGAAFPFHVPQSLTFMFAPSFNSRRCRETIGGFPLSIPCFARAFLGCPLLYAVLVSDRRFPAFRESEEGGCSKTGSVRNYLSLHPSIHPSSSSLFSSRLE